MGVGGGAGSDAQRVQGTCFPAHGWLVLQLALELTSSPMSVLLLLEWEADVKNGAQGVPGSGELPEQTRIQHHVWLQTSPQAQLALARTSRGGLLTWGQNKPNRWQGRHLKHHCSLTGKSYQKRKIWKHLKNEQPRMASLLFSSRIGGRGTPTTPSRCPPWLPSTAAS